MIFHVFSLETPSEINSEIFSRTLPGIPLKMSYRFTSEISLLISPGISSGNVSGIPSKIHLGIPIGISPGIYQGFLQDFFK